MIKKSELKEGMFVKITDVLDRNSFGSRLMKGRYFEVDIPAKEPDDEMFASPSSGAVIMYGVNYVKQVSDNYMEPISHEEQDRLRSIFDNQSEFKDLFKLGKKIDRQIDEIENLLDEIGVYQFDIWEVSDADDLIDQIIDGSDVDLSDFKDELDELKEMFEELETMLDNLSELEDRYISSYVKGKSSTKHEPEFEQTLSTVLNALSEKFQQESYEKYSEFVLNVIKDHNYLNLKDPEEFSLLLATTFNDMVNVLAETVLSDFKVNPEQKHKLKFVFVHYDFIERHLRSVISEYEGSCCETDKTRWLIRTYVQYLLTGQLPKVEERKYWHPRVIRISDWITWMDSIYDLYYGKIERYISAKDNIIENYRDEI